MKISVIMPVHSEKETVVEITRELHQFLGHELFEILIIVSPDSPPETFNICSNLSKEYSRVKLFTQKENPGVGRAYREGFALATGSHVLMIDSDGEMPVATVKLMLDKMKATNCDMVIGSRWMRGGGVRGYDRFKYFLNRGFQLIFRVLLRTRIHDLTLGFKLIKAEIVHSIPWRAVYNNIGVETSMFPIKIGYHVEEVPTVWEKRKSGISKGTFRRNFLYVSTALRVLRSGYKNVLPGNRDTK